MLSPGHPCYSCGFQSTLPARGATRSRTLRLPVSREFQSTLPVWGATSPQPLAVWGQSYFCLLYTSDAADEL